MIPTNVRNPNYWYGEDANNPKCVDKRVDCDHHSWRGVYLECMDINDDIMGVNLPADTPRWTKEK